MMRWRLLLMMCMLRLMVPTGFAQNRGQVNPYYQTYDNQVTGRTYFSRKFTTVVLNDRGSYTLRYRPNTTLNFGVGATYKWATLNLAYGFGFLNPEGGRGKTRYLDLQFHSYGRKISVDVLGQFYNGFYLGPKGTAAPDDRFYLRPDLKVRALGGSVQYIVNHEKFSYRAAFLQNEWQQKSAGSLLVGLEMFAGSIRADSTIIPTTIDQTLAADQITRFSFVEFGPNIGYAYTYVYNKHYFVTGAAVLSLDLGYNNVVGERTRDHHFGLNPNTLFRISGGYNSTSWAITALYVSNALRLANQEGPTPTLRTGNFRVILTHRFRPSKKIKKYLEPIEEIQEQIE
ncbi:DUF4421 domain-containing protein [Pseudochryseolinea flava]|uniref:Signal protein n=1 Tax=Pseudochryseolinea flava TaxID=2059302 RepID=A0A364XZ67_9BACT|nr:DUF4421 domain-containing protein [Pseudochryseolinea flava]RAV99099.1 signal protein [Pseudochryseolinea flava]